MAYVVAGPCLDEVRKLCVEECPVDCIYFGNRMAYIKQDLCVDCGACEPACPAQAIFHESDLPDEWSGFKQVNEDFFEGVEGLPGAGSYTGNASALGQIDHDAPAVMALPKRGL